MKKNFEPVTKSTKDVSDEVTKTKRETSNINNKPLENLIIKFLETLDDRCILASYLTSPLSKITIPKNSTQFKLLKDHNSKRVNDWLIHNTIPIT